MVRLWVCRGSCKLSGVQLWQWLMRKIRCGRSFGRPWKNTFGRPHSNSGKLSDNSEGGTGALLTLNTTVLGTLLTSTEDIVKWWKKHTKDLLNPSVKICVIEAESVDEGE